MQIIFVQIIHGYQNGKRGGGHKKQVEEVGVTVSERYILKSGIKTGKALLHPADRARQRHADQAEISQRAFIPHHQIKQ